LFIAAQSSRTKEENAEKRQKLIAECASKIVTAEAERDGFLWFIDAGIPVDNCIYYSHTNTFCFGWRNPLPEAAAAAINAKLTNFPGKVEFK
jgi:hypothetical protein